MTNFFYVILIWWTSIIAWLINYFYHPLALRFLSINEFAEFESLVSIFNILWVLASWLSLFLVKEISKNSSDLSKVKGIFLFSNKYLLYTWIFIYALFCIFSPLIAKFLHFPSVVPIILIWTIIVLTFQSIVVWAVLQGLKKFKFISISGLIWPSLKIILWVILFYFSYRLYGTIFSFLLSSFFVVIINYIYVLRIFKNTKLSWDEKLIISDLKSDKINILNFFVLTFALSVFMNLDILFAKHLFNWEIAGIYSALSVLGKFLIFLIWAVETVYYPQIMEFEKSSVPRHFVLNSFYMILLVWICSLVGAYFLWTPILNLMKPWLGEYNDLFLLVLIFCLLYWFVWFYSKILMGWGFNKINYLLWFSLLILMLTLYLFWWTDIYNFILILIWILFCLTIILWYYFISKFSR